LRALQADDPALERWLREEVAPTYDAWDKGEMQALSAEEVWANLEVHMNARAKKAG
jgi:antitoxin ParD1/3/4